MNNTKTITHGTQMNGINTIVLAAKLPKTENIDILIISISNTINADDKIKHTIDIHCDRKYLKCVGPYSKTSDLTIILCSRPSSSYCFDYT